MNGNQSSGRQRIQKIIASAGLASRRKAEHWIEQGLVSVNGRRVSLGDQADPEHDVIKVKGQVVNPCQQLQYLLLNKPAGYVTTAHDPQGRPTVFELVKDVPQRLFSVGRLDLNTEGLLLLTNDGNLAHALMHPKFSIAKTYRVKVRGKLSFKARNALERGVVLEDGITAPANVAHVRTSQHNTWFDLSIKEGRNRQVRRMCECVGYTVSHLRRTGFAFLDLSGLPLGKYRHLTEAELKRLRLL